MTLLFACGDPIAMACSQVGAIIEEETYWTASSLLSALLELLLAFVLLLTSTISYLTCIIIKYFGLRPPCFNRESSLIEGKSSQTDMLQDCYSQKFQNLTHLTASGGYWESKASHSSGTDDDSSTRFTSSSTCFNSSSSDNHSPEQGTSQFRSRRSHNIYERPGETNIASQGNVTVNTFSCCIYCSSPFQGTSGKRARKRKFASIIAEELPGCSSDLYDEEILGNNSAAMGYVDVERGSSSKVFPEDVLAFDPENGTESLASPVNVMASENLKFCEEKTHEKLDESSLEGALQSSFSQEIIPQTNGVRELPRDLMVVSEDVILQLNSGINSLLPDNFIPEDGKQHYDSPTTVRSDHSHSSSLAPLVGKDECLFQLEKREAGMKVADVMLQAGNISLDIEYDTNLLRKALFAEREVLNSVYLELEQERNASAISTKETMATITRLQEEKAALQMEARQFQRIAEEKAMYDQEAIAVLRDILLKREVEKLALQKEVELYKQKLHMDRIEELERRKKELDGDVEVAASSGNKCSMLLLEESDESKSSRIVGDQRESFLNITCMPSIQEELPSERMFTKDSLDRNLQSNEAKKSLEYFSEVDNDKTSSIEYLERQYHDNMKDRTLCSTSHLLEVERGEDSVHGDSSDKDIPDSRNSTSGQLNLDEWNQSFKDCQAQLIPNRSVTIKFVEDTNEEELFKKSRCSGLEKWQTVLGRLANLESQIGHLREKQNPEIHGMSIVDQNGMFDKDLGVEGVQFLTALKLGSKFGQDKGSFKFKQWHLPDKEVVIEDGDFSFKSLGNKLRMTAKCKDSIETSEVASENKCTQVITNNNKGVWSGAGYSYSCKFDQTTSEQNTTDSRSHPSHDCPTTNIFNGGNNSLNSGCETPKERSVLVKMDADTGSCSMLAESPLGGEIKKNGGSANQDSLDSLNEQLPTVSRVVDFRTTSMVIRDNSRMALDQEIRKLTSRLQALEADRELMRQNIESMKVEQGEVELLQEIAHQLCELHLSKLKDP